MDLLSDDEEEDNKMRNRSKKAAAAQSKKVINIDQTIPLPASTAIATLPLPPTTMVMDDTVDESTQIDNLDNDDDVKKKSSNTRVIPQTLQQTQLPPTINEDEEDDPNHDRSDTPPPITTSGGKKRNLNTNGSTPTSRLGANTSTAKETPSTNDSLSQFRNASSDDNDQSPFSDFGGIHSNKRQRGAASSAPRTLFPPSSTISSSIRGSRAVRSIVSSSHTSSPSRNRMNNLSQDSFPLADVIMSVLHNKAPVQSTYTKRTVWATRFMYDIENGEAEGILIVKRVPNEQAMKLKFVECGRDGILGSGKRVVASMELTQAEFLEHKRETEIPEMSDTEFAKNLAYRIKSCDISIERGDEDGELGLNILYPGIGGISIAGTFKLTIERRNATDADLEAYNLVYDAANDQFDDVSMFSNGIGIDGMVATNQSNSQDVLGLNGGETQQQADEDWQRRVAPIASVVVASTSEKQAGKGGLMNKFVSKKRRR